ncbi:hypothetical protein [Saccharibacillus sp. JS10]|uniref:hypothetical protein n=1 Tax=Saccharibacillus sp. JS10 TaxID=2950552 RepID=UPI00210CAF14|nr:hypothetical protein [Saccharibacillus sp. JS10]MCQ4087508.1 hypothetical protein [Saccharibacillus sp. JS10]
MTGTKKSTGGKSREPVQGLVDIPELSAQRKAEIQNNIMTEIRSWKKEPEKTVKRIEKRRRWWTGGGIGVGCAGLAVAAVLVMQNGGWMDSNGLGNREGVTVSGQSPSWQEFGAVPIDGSDRYEDILPTINLENAEEAEVAEPRSPMTYEKFGFTWAATANPDSVRVFPDEKKAVAYANSIPLLVETVQHFGSPELGYRYTAWSNIEDGNLRELEFVLGPVEKGIAQDAATDTAVIQFVTGVLQTDLTQSERGEVMDQLRFRDFEPSGGSRMAESKGILYTLDRNGDRQRLIVQFLRKENQPDQFGQLQDSLLKDVREKEVVFQTK